MKEEHTPLPWKVEAFGGRLEIIRDSSITVASVGRRGDHKNEADAKFITLACNVHDELLGAARAALVILNNVRPDGQIFHDLCTAVAKAEGNPCF